MSFTIASCIKNSPLGGQLPQKSSHATTESSLVEGKAHHPQQQGSEGTVAVALRCGLEVEDVSALGSFFFRIMINVGSLRVE